MSVRSRNLVIALTVAALLLAGYVFVLPRFLASRTSPEALLAARENARLLQGALRSYAADARDGRYPVGIHDYAGIQRFFPGLVFPANPRDGGWAAGSFLYRSEDGTTYTASVEVDSPSRRLMTITPLGIGMTDAAVQSSLRRGEHWSYIGPRE